jgi:type IV secretion system protein VirD4
LDNCHVRVAFATNDERTAKRISDALGTATELRCQRNYAGHRLSPWLGHLMVSRQESARALLTPGEVMQLPPHEEIVMVSGHAPVRAQKLRYFDDQNFKPRIVAPPALNGATYLDRPPARPDDWSQLPVPMAADAGVGSSPPSDSDEGGLHRHPDISEALDEVRSAIDSLSVLDESSDTETQESVKNARHLRRIARLASLDPGDGLSL